MSRYPRVALAAVIVAVVGVAPALAILAPPARRPLATLAPAHPSGELAAAAGAPTVVVEARTSDWIKYLDLVIKVMAVILAWFTARPSPSPSPAPLRI